MDPIEEARVIKNVRNRIRLDISNNFLTAQPDYLKAWWAYGLRFSPGQDLYPTIRVEHIDDLCAEARKNKEVFELVKFFVGKRISQRGFVPDAMLQLIGDYLLGNFEPPGLGSGRRKNWGRDIIIQMAMKDVLRECEILATHRRKLSTDPDRMRKTKKSASEIVQIALRETEIGVMEVHRIHKIWENPQKRKELEIFWNLRIYSEFDDEPEALRV